jgi:hypothetical protein
MKSTTTRLKAIEIRRTAGKIEAMCFRRRVLRSSVKREKQYIDKKYQQSRDENAEMLLMLSAFIRAEKKKIGDICTGKVKIITIKVPAYHLVEKETNNN